MLLQGAKFFDETKSTSYYDSQNGMWQTGPKTRSSVKKKQLHFYNQLVIYCKNNTLHATNPELE